MWFAARFEGQDSEIDISPREGHEQEFDAWQWVRVAELPSLVVPFKRAVYERVVAEFAPLVQRLSLSQRPLGAGAWRGERACKRRMKRR